MRDAILAGRLQSIVNGRFKVMHETMLVHKKARCLRLHLLNSFYTEDTRLLGGARDGRRRVQLPFVCGQLGYRILHGLRILGEHDVVCVL